VLIQELYDAEQAGVEIALIVRGICCLRPGLSAERGKLRVISIIDRYLEHARVYYFENAGDPEYLLASVDWMPRNLDQRVELAFPILDPELRAFLLLQLADTEKARELGPDGRSRRLREVAGQGVRSQAELYARAQHATRGRQRTELPRAERLSTDALGTDNARVGLSQALQARKHDDERDDQHAEAQ
jgi:polyphosphate kinase